MKKYLIILLISLILITTISNVSAEDTFTITVTDKHILGNSGGGIYGGPLFILEDFHKSNSIGDCLVHPQDYYNVHMGDAVTLKAPDKYGYCEIIKINNQEINNGGWN